MSDSLEVSIVKDWLRQYADRQKERSLLQDALDNLIASSENPPSTKFTGMPKSPNKALDRIGDYIQRREALEALLEESFAYGVHTRAQIEAVLRHVRRAEGRMIIRYRYIDGLAWPDIVDTLFCGCEDLFYNTEKYSKRVFSYHAQALEQMAEAIANRKNGVPSWAEIAA